MLRYVKFVLRWRVAVVLLFVAITVVFGLFFAKARLSSSIGDLFFSNNPAYESYLDRQEVFSSDFIVLVGIQGKDLTSPENIQKLADLCDELEGLPTVDRVESLASTQHIESRDDTLVIEDYGDLFQDQPEKRDALLKTLNTDELTRDWLVTPDGGNTVVLLEMSQADESWEKGQEVVAGILSRFEQAGFEAKNLHQAGLAAVMSACTHQALYSLKNILPVTACILFAMVFLMFRRLWPVLITMAITGMAVTWTMGLAVILFEKLNIITTMIPGIVLIICFSDVIHLVSAYLIEIGRGKEKREAILDMAEEVGTACGYTSITTFFGFVAMALVPTPVFRQTGLLLGFGVAVALFMAMTLVPVFLSFMPRPKAWRTGSTSRVQEWVDRRLNGIARLSYRRPWLVMILFSAFFLVCVYGASRVTFETRFSERFAKGHEISQGADWFEATFPGTNPVDIYLDAESEEGFLDPELLAKADQFEEEVSKIPGVVQVLSLNDLLKKMLREINPEMAEEHPLPQTRQAVAQLLLLFEMSGGEDLDQMVSPDRKTLRVTARMRDIGVIETAERAKEAAAAAQRAFGPGVKVEATGMKPLMGDWVDEVVRGQRNGLLFAIVTIAVFMILATRSLRIGLLSMLPNMLPLLTLLAWAGIFWHTTDTDAMGVLMIAIGIGVDDTIHFLMRLKFESGKTADEQEAVRHTLHFSGRAIIMTSVILVAGFVPFSMSDYFSVHILGTMLPACLAVALLADLFWVPAMVRLGILRYPKAKS